MAIDAAQLRVVVSADTSKATSELKSFSGGMKNMAGGMAAVGGFLTASVAAPLIGIGVSAVKTAASFEKSMNVLEYVTGGTADTMKKMQDQALQLGADTVFSAGEAAEGMVELGKAGMDTEDIMDAIPGVMNLAAAGQVSVGEAAGLTAATLATFNMEAEDSGKVADILASAANASSADVADLAFGVKNAGAVFAASGQPVETLATLMALLANKGIDASDAATSLKTVHMRLTAPTEKAAAVMRKMGIATYDAEGNMRDYEDIIEDMVDATKDMTQEQRDGALAILFGADAVRSANAVIDSGVDAYREMNLAVQEQGASAGMAEAQNKGLEGAISALSGSLETLQIKLALPFLETISGWTEKLAGFVNKLGEIPQPVVEATLIFLGIAGAAGLALLAISGIAAAIGALKAAGIAGVVGPISLAVLGLAAAAAGAWLIWSYNWGNIQESVQPFIDKFGEAKVVVEDFFKYLGTAWEEGDVFNAWLLSIPIEMLPFAESMASALISVKDFVTESQKVLQNLASYFLAVIFGAAALNIWLFTLPESVKDFAFEVGEAIVAVEGWGTAIGEAFTEADIPTFEELFADLLAGDFTTLIGGLQAGLDSLVLNLETELKLSLGMEEDEPWDIAKRITQMVNDITTAVNKLDVTTIDWWTLLNDLIITPIGAAMAVMGFSAETLTNLVTAVQDAITAIPWGDLGGAFAGLTTAVITQLGNVVNDIIADLTPLFFLASLTIGEQVRLLREQMLPKEAVAAPTVHPVTGMPTEMPKVPLDEQFIRVVEAATAELEAHDWGAEGTKAGTNVRNAFVLGLGAAFLVEINLTTWATDFGGKVEAALRAINWSGMGSALAGMQTQFYANLTNWATDFGPALLGTGDKPKKWFEETYGWGKIGPPEDPNKPLFDFSEMFSSIISTFTNESIAAAGSVGVAIETFWANVVEAFNTLIPDIDPSKWFGGSDPKTGGAAGKGESMEQMALRTHRTDPNVESLFKNAGVDIGTQVAAAGTEFGSNFKTAAAPVGTEIGNDVAAAIKTHAALTKGPDPILSQQKNLLEGAEFTLPTLDWATFVVPLNWAEHVMSLIWDSYVMRLAWESFVTILEWGSHIPDLSWGNYISTVDWGRYIPTAPIEQAAPGKNASGTPYWKGGPTWVGEEGPELVTLPQGARIYSNADSMAMAGTTINVFVDSINSALDIEVLAAQLAKRFQQKMRS